jgi:hypothetical protein
MAREITGIDPKTGEIFRYSVPITEGVLVGYSGYSGYSAASGYSGYSGPQGTSGYSGYSG